MPENDLPTSDNELESTLTPDELGAMEEEATPDIDPATLITVRSSTGASQYVIASAPIPLSEVIRQSNLAIAGAYEVYMDGNQITGETLVPPGASVTIVGAVKGA